MTSSKYKYDKGDGTMVSRQRMHQLRNPGYGAEAKKKYLAKFKKEHGMSYYLWNKYHKGEELSKKKISIIGFLGRAKKNKA